MMLARYWWNSWHTHKRKNAAFLLILIIISFYLVDILVVKRYLFFYVTEEWLINYSKGFIRRGLPGEVLLFFNNTFGLDAFTLIKAFSYLIFLIFIGVYITKVKQSLKLLDLETLLVVLLLPSLLLFPLHDPKTIGRKEFLFFIGLFVNLLLLDRAMRDLSSHRNWECGEMRNNIINRYCYRLFIWYNLLSVPAALAHESIIFISLPLNIMITLSLVRLRFPNYQFLTRTLLIYSPTTFTALLCLLLRGDESVALAICQSWQENISQYASISCDSNYLPAIDSISETGTIGITSNVPWSLQYVGLPVRYYIIENLRNNIYNQNGMVLLKWLLSFVICAFLLIRTSFGFLIKAGDKITTEILDQDSAERFLKTSFEIRSTLFACGFIVKYALIPFAFSFVMYLITQDWGRWFFFASASFAICFLSRQLILLEVLGSSRKDWDGWNSSFARLVLPLHSACFRFEHALYEFPLIGRLYTIFRFILMAFALLVLRIPHHQDSWSPFLKPWAIDLLR